MREEGKIIAGQRFYLRNSHMQTMRLAKPLAQAASQHWFLKVTIGLLLICILIWGWQKITNPRTFPVRKVQIRGDYTHIDRAVLRQIVLLFVQSGFLSIDITGLQDRLQQLPWVDSVQVKKEWPDRLVIVLKEQHPVARFSEDTLVNARGELFTVNEETIPSHLPLFLGQPGQQKLLLQMYQQATAILQPFNHKIVKLVLNERGGWALQLDNGIVLLLGRVDPLKRLQRFVQISTPIIGDRITQINSIDLRYTDGLAVTFKVQGLSSN